MGLISSLQFSVLSLQFAVLKMIPKIKLGKKNIEIGKLINFMMNNSNKFR